MPLQQIHSILCFHTLKIHDLEFLVLRLPQLKLQSNIVCVCVGNVHASECALFVWVWTRAYKCVCARMRSWNQEQPCFDFNAQTCACVNASAQAFVSEYVRSSVYLFGSVRLPGFNHGNHNVKKFTFLRYFIEWKRQDMNLL